MQQSSLFLRDPEQIHAFYLENSGMEPGFIQLSTDPINLNVHQIDLDGLTLIWASAKGRSRWRDQSKKDGSLMFAFAVDAEAPIAVRGKEVDEYCACVWVPDQEIDYVFHGAYQTLEIFVGSDLCDILGWQIAGDPVCRITKPHRDAILSICRSATIIALQRNQVTDRSVDLCKTHGWRDLILDALAPAVKPWLGTNGTIPAFPASKKHDLVRAADIFFDSWDPSHKFEIDTLVEHLGVHRRVLFYAFRELLGVGPKRYLELRRLYALRNALKMADSQKETVKSIAESLGFVETGRMAVAYRKHFGESPSVTLKN